jgi:phosphoribosylaminoimidazole-succinocarboxamide synthase
MDKEIVRIWHVERGYRGDGVAPKMPDDFIQHVSAVYVDVYQRITGQRLPSDEPPTDERMLRNLKKAGIV